MGTDIEKGAVWPGCNCGTATVRVPSTGFPAESTDPAATAATLLRVDRGSEPTRSLTLTSGTVAPDELATDPRIVNVSVARGAMGSSESTSMLIGALGSSAATAGGAWLRGCAVAGLTTAPHHASATAAISASGVRPITRCRLHSLRGAS